MLQLQDGLIFLGRRWLAFSLLNKLKRRAILA